MKRITGLIIALCILICSVPNAFAGDVNSTAEVKSVYGEFLTNLKILDFEFESETKIDRKLFAYLLCKVTNVQTLVSDPWEFKDVDEKCRFNMEIECAASLGWMKPDSKGMFYPHNPVSLNDAVLAFVKMLGYEQHAEAGGGYLIMANRLGLMDSVEVKNQSDLSLDEVYAITYNFLHTNVMRQYVYGTNVSYTDMPEISAMEYYLDIKYKGGILDGNYITSLTGESTLGEGRISVDGEIFKCDENLYREYIGYYVNCYFKANEPQTAIYMYPHHKKNTEITIYGKDVTDVSITSKRTLVKYETDDTSYKEITLSAIGDVLYNGKAYLNYPQSCFKGKSAVIKFIDNTGDRIYDVAVIYNYTTTVVDTVSPSAEIITDKYDSAYNLYLSDKNDVIYEIYRNGESITLSEVSEWDILSVAKSTDGKYYKIISERRSITGTIDMISSDTEKYLVVDGTEYDVSPDIRENYEAGQECDFYFDFLGRIAALKITDSNQKLYGYLLKMRTVNQKLDIQYKVKLITQKGEVKVYTLREKLDYNGIPAKAEDVITDSLLVSGDETIQQLIKYSVNSKDEITYLNTADAAEGEDYLSKDYALTNAYYTNVNYSFDSKCFLDDDTVVFIIPSTGDKNDETLYEIGNLSTFIAYTRYNIEAYDYDDYNVAKAVVAKIDSSEKITTTTSLFLISSIITTLDENGNIVDGLRGVQNKMNVTFNLKDGVSASGYKAGDIVRLAMNSKNEICLISPVITDFNADNIETKYGLSDAIMASFLSAVGRVEKVKGTRLVLNTSADPATDELSAWNLCYSGICVYTYYTHSNKTELSEVSEICVGDTLIMRSRAGRVYDVFIIK